MALDKLTKLTSQSGITTTIDYQMSDLTVDTITVQSGGLKMPVGMSTFQNVTVTGDLTVNGTTTTLDTDLIGVDKLEVSGNNTTAVGIITQAGSGDILRLYDNTSEVFKVTDGGGIKLSNTADNHLFEYGNSNVHASAAINIIRYGSGYADIRLASNYGTSVRLAGASDNTDEFFIQQDNTKTAYVWNEAAASIIFGTNNTSKMWLDKDGNFKVVGVSTFNSNIHVGQDITHLGDDDTKIFFGTNSVTVKTGGQNNVGIGTSVTTLTSPSGYNTIAKFQHQGNSGYGNIILDRTVNAFIIDNDPSNASNNQSYFAVKNKGTENLRIDSAGNMGLGITPDAQGGTVDSLQIGTATNLYNESSDDYTILGNNVYHDGSNNKYIKTNQTSRLMQNAGEFTFQQAASGSADANITYTTALKITSGGTVNIGGDYTNTSGKLKVTGNVNIATGDIIFLNSNHKIQNGSSASTLNIQGGASNAGGKIELRGGTGDNDIRFLTSDGSGNSVEKVRITSDGNVGVGTVTPQSMLDVRGNVVIGIDQVSGNPGNTTGIATIRGHFVNAEGDFARLSFSNSLSASGAATRSSASIRGLRLGDNLGTGLAFWTNPTSGANPGVERLRIDQTGTIRLKRSTYNTGAVTVNNAALYLDIGTTEGAANINQLIGFGYRNASTGAKPAYIGYQATDWSSHTKGDLIFGTRNSTGATDEATERLRITSTGQFHMGGGNSWTYASQKFVLVEPNNALGMILQGNNANEGVNLTLQNIVNANNAYSSLSFADDGGQIFGIVRGKVNDKNANTGELQFWTSGSQKLTIDKDGDVGIGEASPGSNNEKLTVREDIAAASGKAIISIFNLYQGTSGQGNASTGALEFTFKNHNASHNWWGGRIACFNTDNYNQYTYLRFDTASQGNASGKMWLTHNGRLGIGTDNPGENLHISSSTPAIRLTDTDTAGPLHCDIESVSGDLYLDTGSIHRDVIMSSVGRANELAKFEGDGNVIIGGSVKTGNLSGRNILINGDMRIKQRLVGTSNVTGVTANGYHALDRWYVNLNGPTLRIERDSDNPGHGFEYSMAVTTTTESGSLAAGNVIKIGYNVEGYDIARLGYGDANAKSFTLSFWVKSSLTGVFAVTFTRDSKLVNRQVTVSSANTWEFKSVTIAGDTAAAFGNVTTSTGMSIGICPSAGSNSTGGSSIPTWSSFHNAHTAYGANMGHVTTNGAVFKITGAQLEIGGVATPFEFKPYDQELTRCKRYFQDWRDFQAFANKTADSTYDGHVVLGSFELNMRANPTITRQVYGRIAGGSGWINGDNNEAAAIHHDPSSTYPGRWFLMTGTWNWHSGYNDTIAVKFHRCTFDAEL